MQKVIVRARPRPSVAAPAAPTTAAAPAVPQRRLRMASDRLDRLARDREVMLAQLQLISNSEAAIDAAQANIDAANAKLEELMRTHKMTTFDDGALIAEIKEVFSRQSRKVDPKVFRSKVTADDFWKCVSVDISKAEEVMGSRALNGIADVTPAKSTGYVLKVRQMKKK